MTSGNSSRLEVDGSLADSVPCHESTRSTSKTSRRRTSGRRDRSGTKSRRRSRSRRRPDPELDLAQEESDGRARNINPAKAGARIIDDHGIDVADFDSDAVKVVRRLAGRGFQTYLVGGCVRDVLAGVRPKDFDLATTATPLQVTRLFGNSRIVGRRFRLVHVHFRDHIVEVSTFRQQADQVAGDAVASTKSADSSKSRASTEATENMAESTDSGSDDVERDLLIRRDNVFGGADEDAVRRDFTCNALFYDVDKNQVIDFVGGYDDIRRGCIEVIGDPETRLREDPVRMLRAIKFAARLDFRLALDLRDGIKVCREDVWKASRPRLYEELQRLLRHGCSFSCFRLLDETGLLRVFLPEIADWIRDERRGVEGEVSGAKRFWNSLRSLDRMINGERPVSTVVMLGAPLVHLAGHLLDGANASGKKLRGDISTAVDDVMRPLATRLQMPRRDLSRLRTVIVAMRRLLGGPTNRRSRRSSPTKLVRREHFPEALQLFEIYSQATGRHQSEVIQWRERYDRSMTATSSD